MLDRIGVRAIELQHLGLAPMGALILTNLEAGDSVEQVANRLNVTIKRVWLARRHGESITRNLDLPGDNLMKVAPYANVSTRDKDQAPEAQLLKLRDFATGRNGNRPGLKKLLKDARAGEFQTAVIIRIDRIMRSPSNLYELFQDFETWNVCMVATDQEIDTNTTTGRLMFGLLGPISS